MSTTETVPDLILDQARETARIVEGTNAAMRAAEAVARAHPAPLVRVGRVLRWAAVDVTDLFRDRTQPLTESIL